MKIKNYTPHVINITDKKTKISHEFKSKGNIRLLQKNKNLIGEWNSIPIYSPPTYSSLEGMPTSLLENKEEEIGILVSMPVGNYLSANPKQLPSNISVYGPDTSPENSLRNEKGDIVESYALIKYK
jgi:hypothetical protein